MIRQAFAPDLLWATACTDGVNQLNTIGIDHSKRRWGSQERLRPGLMHLEEAKEAGRLGEPGKQRPIVACQRYKGRLPTPLRACRSPRVTTSLGQRLA